MLPVGKCQEVEFGLILILLQVSLQLAIIIAQTFKYEMNQYFMLLLLQV
jgi:hypothetical protein